MKTVSIISISVICNKSLGRTNRKVRNVVFCRAHGGDGGDRGNEDVGEHQRTAGKARNAKVGDPVGPRKTEERGFGDRNVRREERRAMAIGSYRLSADEKGGNGVRSG